MARWQGSMEIATQQLMRLGTPPHSNLRHQPIAPLEQLRAQLQCEQQEQVVGATQTIDQAHLIRIHRQYQPLGMSLQTASPPTALKRLEGTPLPLPCPQAQATPC
jgi:hypothetical protein